MTIVVFPPNNLRLRVPARSDSSLYNPSVGDPESPLLFADTPPIRISPHTLHVLACYLGRIYLFSILMELVAFFFFCLIPRFFTASSLVFARQFLQLLCIQIPEDLLQRKTLFLFVLFSLHRPYNVFPSRAMDETMAA